MSPSRIRNLPTLYKNMRYFSLVLALLPFPAYLLTKKHTETSIFEGYAYDEKLSRWEGYRINDGVHQMAENQCDVHPFSIVCKYRTETIEPCHIPTLISIMDNFKVKDIPNKHTAVIHVRLGDGLCQRVDPVCRGDRTNEPDCWHRGTDCWFDQQLDRRYAFSKVQYIGIFKVLHKIGVKSAVIVGDPRHWTRTADLRERDYSVDEAYVRNMVATMQTYGISTQVRQTQSPDEDFLYMCSAKIFVRGGGGFSKLIATIVKEYRNGTVFDPYTDG